MNPERITNILTCVVWVCSLITRLSAVTTTDGSYSEKPAVPGVHSKFTVVTTWKNQPVRHVFSIPDPDGLESRKIHTVDRVPCAFECPDGYVGETNDLKNTFCQCPQGWTDTLREGRPFSCIPEKLYQTGYLAPVTVRVFEGVRFTGDNELIVFDERCHTMLGKELGFNVRSVQLNTKHACVTFYEETACQGRRLFFTGSVAQLANDFVRTIGSAMVYDRKDTCP